MYGSPDALEELAKRLEMQADRVREQAADHVRRGRAAEWVSVAATSYRACITQDRSRADGVATQLDEAAAALRAHAQEVRDTVALIAKIEREVSAWATRTTSAAVDFVGDLVDKIPALPPPGDLRWLDFGSLLRDES